MGLSVVILAAGQGKRMCSSLPKVLHKIADKPLLEHVIDTSARLHADDVHIVYGHGGELVPQALNHKETNWVLQKEQLGTGHAVSQALPDIESDHRVLVLYGDVPLISQRTLQALLDAADKNSVGLLTINLSEPEGYGRIVRDAKGAVSKIIEQKDATPTELNITEVNTGILVAPCAKLRDWLSHLTNSNQQGEYYLTDIIEMAVTDGVEVKTANPEHEHEVLGVNNKKQLAELERKYQMQIADSLMEQGVTLRDPARIDVRGSIRCGADTLIDINVVFEGDVVIGKESTIGPNCCIKNARIGDGVQILANTVIEDAEVGSESRVGPFARLRPGTVLGQQTHVGNYVEVKKASVGKGSKINHLSYVGDACIGENVNIGAGTITCNYDGANKHLTEIGNNVFVGSDTQLIAPVKVGDGTTIGAGSTITKSVPKDVLVLSRSKQVVVESWTRPQKNKK